MITCIGHAYKQGSFVCKQVSFVYTQGSFVYTQGSFAYKHLHSKVIRSMKIQRMIIHVYKSGPLPPLTFSFRELRATWVMSPGPCVSREKQRGYVYIYIHISSLDVSQRTPTKNNPTCLEESPTYAHCIYRQKKGKKGERENTYMYMRSICHNARPQCTSTMHVHKNIVTFLQEPYKCAHCIYTKKKEKIKGGKIHVYICAREPYKCAKLCMSEKEKYVSAKTPPFSQKRPVYRPKSPIFPQKNPMYRPESPIFPPNQSCMMAHVCMIKKRAR